MKITDLDMHSGQGRTRLSARVSWEDCDRPARQLYVEVDDTFAAEVWPNPEAFVCAAFVPALSFGERRIAVPGRICPTLQRGLRGAARILRHWYDIPHATPRLEPAAGFATALADTATRTATCLSGGVDSLFTLRCNRLTYPPQHRHAIRDAFIVHGFDLGGIESAPARLDLFQQMVQGMQQIAQQTDLQLIPVHTNIRHLEQDCDFWSHRFHGACLAAIGHLFNHRIGRLVVAGSFEFEELIPWGSHPLLDGNFASAALDVLHDGCEVSRYEKLKLIAQWDLALEHLRVCWNSYAPSGQLNCGECEKCIRTMLMLLAVDKLKDCHVFGRHDLQARDFFRRCVDITPTIIRHYLHPLEDLRRVGRGELADVVLRRIEQQKRYRVWTRDQGWKGKLRQLDRAYLGGTLLKLDRALRG